MKILKILVTLLGLFVFAVGGLIGLGAVTAYAPGPQEDAPIVCPGAPRTLAVGDTFTVVSWNLQYAASRKHNFFYDGGEVVRVPQEDVDETIAQIAQALKALDPDIALLQEIDRNSDRTGRVDQMQAYLAILEPACWNAAPYHLAPYVPFPLPETMGRVDMELGILSDYALEGGARHQLTLLDEPWIRQQFNLKRALLEARIPLEGGGSLRLGTTHLSAFSYGDGTLAGQVAQLKAWMSEEETWILAGDYNMLPPGDDDSRLTQETQLFGDTVNPILEIVPTFATAVPPEEMLEPEWRTYLPFGTSEPDRKIDYIQHGPELTVVEVEVHREYSHISDHLPIRIVFRLGPEPEPELTEPTD